MVEKWRNAGTCKKCGKPVRQLVDEMMILQSDEVYDTQVLEDSCSPGCSGPRDRELGES
jgi:hypothetical protein